MKTMNKLDRQEGFTLLELIISLALVVMVVAISFGGVRMGVTSYEIANQKIETYQRLRFIKEQLSQKIRSINPLFINIQVEPLLIETAGQQVSQTKLLVFEGKPESLRFVTFAAKLNVGKRNPQMHETTFYLGEHPETGEAGLIMAERKVTYEDPSASPFTEPAKARYVLLAKDVPFLKFRYFKMSLLEDLESDAQGNKVVKYKGEWVDKIDNQLFDLPGLGQEPGGPERMKQISLPRAIEVSMGLLEPSFDKDEEAKVVLLPRTIIPLYTGLVFKKPPEKKNEAS